MAKPQNNSDKVYYNGISVDLLSAEIGMNANQSILDRRTVLVVDDFEDNLPIACYVLESLGLSAIAETSAGKALRLASQHQPALILLDILMPEMSGFEFMQSLRGDRRTATIPVIAMTALTQAEDRAEILQAGCVDCIQKPFELEDLEAIVQRYL